MPRGVYKRKGGFRRTKHYTKAVRVIEQAGFVPRPISLPSPSPEVDKLHNQIANLERENENLRSRNIALNEQYLDATFAAFHIIQWFIRQDAS